MSYSACPMHWKLLFNGKYMKTQFINHLISVSTPKCTFKSIANIPLYVQLDFKSRWTKIDINSFISTNYLMCVTVYIRYTLVNVQKLLYNICSPGLSSMTIQIRSSHSCTAAHPHVMKIRTQLMQGCRQPPSCTCCTMHMTVL